MERKIPANVFTHNIFRDIIKEETREEVRRIAKKHQNSSLLSKWKIERTFSELPIYYDPFHQVYGKYAKRYNNTGLMLGTPSGYLDVVWLLKRNGDDKRKRALCHEIKTGHFNLDEPMKYKNQSSMIHHTPILPARDTENQLWIWAWNKSIEEAKLTATGETLDMVEKGIIRLNPLELIEKLYEEIVEKMI